MDNPIDNADSLTRFSGSCLLAPAIKDVNFQVVKNKTFSHLIRNEVLTLSFCYPEFDNMSERYTRNGVKDSTLNSTLKLVKQL